MESNDPPDIVSPMASEATAKRWAALASLAAALVAIVLVVIPGVRDLSFDADVYERRVVTETVVEDGPKGRTVTKTSKAADDSAIERSLGDGGLLLVRMGVAAAAAFLAGAVVLRVALGRYGFKAGGLELEDVTTAAVASEEALIALTAIVDEQRRTASTALRTAAEALQLAADATSRLDDLGPDGQD